jgi:hypothetical protein
MADFGIFYGHLVYVTAIWYILWLLGKFFQFLVCCTWKNLATLARANKHRNMHGFQFNGSFVHFQHCPLSTLAAEARLQMASMRYLLLFFI